MSVEHDDFLIHDASEISAVLKSPSGDEVDVDISKQSERIAIASFVPIQAGVNVMHLQKNDHSTPAVQIPVMVRGIAKIDSQSLIPLECNSVDFQEVFDTTKAELVQPNGKSERLRIRRDTNHVISTILEPDQVGKHIIRVYDGEREVLESPFTITVRGEERDYAKIGQLSKTVIHQSEPIRRYLGELTATIESKSGRTIEAKIEANRTENSFTVLFTPEESGDHMISVKRNAQHIHNSPFTVAVFGEDFIRSIEEEQLEIFNRQGDLEAHRQCVNQEKFFESNTSTSSTDIVNRRKDKPKCEASTSLELPEVKSYQDLKYCRGMLQSPSGREEEISLIFTDYGHVEAKFEPYECGKYKLYVTKNGIPVTNSPFSIEVSDIDLSQEYLNHELSPRNTEAQSFNLSRAFEVTPEIKGGTAASYMISEIKSQHDLNFCRGKVQSPSGKINQVELSFSENGFVEVKVESDEVGEHLIDIEKDGRPVHGSPFSLNFSCTKHKRIKEEEIMRQNSASDAQHPIIMSPCFEQTASLIENISTQKNSTYKHGFTQKKSSRTLTEVTASFEILEICSAEDLKDCIGLLQHPNGSKTEVVMSFSDENNSVNLNFCPHELGEYLVYVTKKGIPVNSSPFTITVNETEGLLSRDLENELVLAKSIESGIESKYEAFEKRESTSHESFDQMQKHSTFETDESSRKREFSGRHENVGHPVTINLEISELDLPKDIKQDILDVELKGPSGQSEPVHFSTGPNGELAITFTPSILGKHIVDVKKRGRRVKHSPIEITIGSADSDSTNSTKTAIGKVHEEEEVNLSKIPPIPEGEKPAVGCQCELSFDFVDFTKSDIGDINALLVSPSGTTVPVKIKVGEEDCLAISFLPDEVGKHLLNLTKKNEPYSGSPFEIVVVEGIKSSNKPSVGRKFNVEFASCDIYLPTDLPITLAQLRRPNGIQETLQCSISADHNLEFEFTPKEVGKHMIIISKNGKKVQGSPLEFDAGERKDRKVPVTEKECQMQFEVEEIDRSTFASLSGALKRPKKKSEDRLELHYISKNMIGAKFTPSIPGKHQISILRHGQPIEGSPFEVDVEERSAIFSPPHVGKLCYLTLDIKAKVEDLKLLKGSIERPTGVSDQLDLSLDPHGSLVISFVPRIEGIHVASIKRDGSHIKGSPVDIVIGHKKKEHACKRAFELPDLNIKMEVSKMTAVMQSPQGSEIPVEILESSVGGMLVASFIPTKTGSYYLHIKEGDRIVRGSPICIEVTDEDVIAEQSHPSKVRCYGTGMTYN